jgi:hypothetical protein
MSQKRSIAAKKIADFNAAHAVGTKFLLDGEIVKTFGKAGYDKTWRATVFIHEQQEPVEIARLKKP